MNKRGSALLLSLIVTLVLSILSATLYSGSINESNLTRRHVASTQALWFAEKGSAQAIAQLTSTSSLGNYTSEFNTTTQSVYTSGNSTTYKITSTGRSAVDEKTVERAIENYVKYDPYQADENFNYAIEVNGPLTLQGSYEILPDDQEDSYYYKENASVSFASRFGFSSEELKNLAIYQGTYYEDPSSPLMSLPNQVTWIKITNPEDQLKIPTTGWSGSGILVIEGDTNIEGGTFDGIIWVIGKLTITGNANLSGTVVSECEIDVTAKVAGNPVLEWDNTTINNALSLLGAFADRTILSWRETQ